MDRAKLRELADQVEAASGPDRELDAEIHDAVGNFDWWDQCTIPCNIPRDAALRNGAREYTASLDAAMSLVPEGRGWLIGMGQTRPDEPMAGAQIIAHAQFAGYDVANDVIAEGEGATPALALTAACLRAIASQEQGEV